MTSPKSSHRLAVSAIMLAASSGAASAGSLSEPTMNPSPAPVEMTQTMPVTDSWTGGYIGGSIGYAKLQGSFKDTNLFPSDLDGAAYGVFAGYNYDLGALVLGGELQYEATNLEEANGGLNLDGIARLKVRLGYDAGAFMPFISGGLAQANVSDSSLAGNGDGAFAGLGVDYRVGQNYVVGAEVSHNRFNDFQADNVDFKATTASLRVSFAF
ncbi:outer membrane protein [Loktanella sp. DJP18]|uniref:outer membrane protein n=1 Tax=Loktanella sp. DJP18 TaxID=3409788 RepID=UPI003BB570A0